MMKLLVTMVLFGMAYSQLPHGHELHVLMQQGFNYLDKDHNGYLSQTEFSSFIDAEDANHDGFVTLEEYMAYLHFPLEIAGPIFAVWDTDHDGKIANDHMQAGVALMDTDGDGQVSMKEYEHFQSGFLLCVFNEHGGHGHGNDCTQWHTG